MSVSWRDHIVSDSDVLRGKPRLKNTRIAVSLVLGCLAEGWTATRIIEEYPDLTETHINACLDFARELAETETAAP